MRHSGRPIVLKVGGSLLGWPDLPGRLRMYLRTLEGRAPVLVVGGGGAADFVRELDSVHGIGDKRSHALALRALDLTAHALAAVVDGLEVVDRPEGLAASQARGAIPVLSPLTLLDELDRGSADALPECWDVTTDSIAARAAVRLGADELRLLKSTGLGGVVRRYDAVAAGLVDPFFPTAARVIGHVLVVNLRGEPPTTEELKPD